jgi:lipopolysaccharide transport system ATP-binding protein
MRTNAIEVRNLSKRYRIGSRASKFPTLRESASQIFSSTFRADRRARQEREAELWALRDVSFDIAQGEVTGVIGRNGAGKSTLLKILSRITEPTEGSADIYGRVGSLLEVGTGFHPELTGRENIYLNGAILGMRRSEIDRKFDEIVQFAEITRFLDTVVKHYSTGMFMRLAFSVAAHLDPEILLVDEVLAVGDAEFQRKCLGKMNGVAREGRTVLFVSHNMPAVQSLCSRCIVLKNGQLEVAGSVQEGIRLYHSGGLESGEDSARGEVAITSLRVNGSLAPHVMAGSNLCFDFLLSLRAEISGFRMILMVEDSRGVVVLHAVQTERDQRILREPGEHRVSLQLPSLMLTPGGYSFYVKFIYNGVDVGGRYVSDKALLTLEGDYSPDSAPGVLSPPLSWFVEPAAKPDPEPDAASSLLYRL